jgi:hypothetical protein
MLDHEAIDFFKTNVQNIVRRTLETLQWRVRWCVLEEPEFLALQICDCPRIAIPRCWEYQESLFTVEWRVAELIEACFRIKMTNVHRARTANHRLTALTS